MAWASGSLLEEEQGPRVPLTPLPARLCQPSGPSLVPVQVTAQPGEGLRAWEALVQFCAGPFFTVPVTQEKWEVPPPGLLGSWPPALLGELLCPSPTPPHQLPGMGLLSWEDRRRDLLLKLRRRVPATFRDSFLGVFRMSGQDLGWTPGGGRSPGPGTPSPGWGHGDLASSSLLAPLSLSQVLSVVEEPLPCAQRWQLGPPVLMPEERVKRCTVLNLQRNCTYRTQNFFQTVESSGPLLLGDPLKQGLPASPQLQRSLNGPNGAHAWALYSQRVTVEVLSQAPVRSAFKILIKKNSGYLHVKPTILSTFKHTVPGY